MLEKQCECLIKGFLLISYHHWVHGSWADQLTFFFKLLNPIKFCQTCANNIMLICRSIFRLIAGAYSLDMLMQLCYLLPVIFQVCVCMHIVDLIGD